MEITIAAQTQVFLWSCVLGAGLSLFYDCFRVFRIAIRGTVILVALEDFIYFTVSAVVTYRFFIATTSGQFRIYLLIGILLGWIICHLTVGAVLLKISTVIINAVKRFFRFLFRIFIRPFIRLGKFIGRKIAKIQKISANRLKKAAAVVYNQGDIKMRKKAGDVSRGKKTKKKTVLPDR